MQSASAPEDKAHRPEDSVPLWQRLSPILSILAPTCVSLAIGVLAIKDYRSTAALYDLAVHNRPRLQVIVHVLTTLLAVPWTYAVCTTLNLSTRALFSRRPARLDTLRFWTATGQARMDFNLPFYHFVTCTLISAITLLPGWLWTGALTPQFTLAPTQGEISILAAGPGSWPFVQPYAGDVARDCLFSPPSTRTSNSFTTCSGTYKSSALLQSAGSAITASGAAWNHSKPDDTGYQYIGRSYGAGAAVGWDVAPPSGHRDVEGYYYTEPGYLTNISCMYNSSSLWVLSDSQTNGGSRDPFLPTVFLAQGWMPNSNWTQFPANTTRSMLQSQSLEGNTVGADWYAQVTFGSTDGVVSIGGVNNDQSPDYFVAFAAGANYRQLDTIQCQCFFHPTAFNVSVSMSNRTISVSSLQPIPEIEPRNSLKAKVMRNIVDVAKIETTLYTSTLGDAFNESIRTLAWRENNLHGTDIAGRSTSPDMVLEAVEQSLLAMTDDILVWIASTGLALNSSVTVAQTRQQALALSIGSPAFVLAVVVFHLVTLIAVLVISTYTRLWAGLTSFDYSDSVSLSMSTYLAGRYMRGTSPEQLQVHMWSGDADAAAFKHVEAVSQRDDETGRMQVMFRNAHRKVGLAGHGS
ncbi:hypothetical protein K431DRAFT_227396 [Polychaeton citri CBS 116435]|uniref:Uncharacterized protein n=1 Tax=Polychaeton citri CBS 116435 TaxID=1314669 RepID=A0A9P4Q7V1_9PEZI|nr:hypothetical protein K431DRAFT_227396 [Polychaeton citri CBS 116435]